MLTFGSQEEVNHASEPAEKVADPVHENVIRHEKERVPQQPPPPPPPSPPVAEAKEPARPPQHQAKKRVEEKKETPAGHEREFVSASSEGHAESKASLPTLKRFNPFSLHEVKKWKKNTLNFLHKDEVARSTSERAMSKNSSQGACRQVCAGDGRRRAGSHRSLPAFLMATAALNSSRHSASAIHLLREDASCSVAGELLPCCLLIA